MWSLDTSTVRGREWHKKIISLFSSRFSLSPFLSLWRVEFRFDEKKRSFRKHMFQRILDHARFFLTYELSNMKFVDEHSMIRCTHWFRTQFRTHAIDLSSHLCATIWRWDVIRIFGHFSLDKQKGKCSHIEMFRFDYQISAKSTRKWSCRLHLLCCPSLLSK